MMNKIEGDLLQLAYDGEFDIIVHGANCQNTMGSGIAGQIAKRFPQAVEADKKTVAGGRDKLGHYSFARVPGKDDHHFYIINAYTQFNYGGGSDLFEYEHFDRFLKGLSLCLTCTPGVTRIGFPYIGCGLAGGDENRIVEKIEEFSKILEKSAEVTLVRFSK